ncbi:hypothetical protein NJ7G_2342 [Natrinema sp. J7-2]|nr:hypothetical protein NJ7G_2342 [Natrinema sp. J7-2]
MTHTADRRPRLARDRIRTEANRGPDRATARGERMTASGCDAIDAGTMRTINETAVTPAEGDR